MRHSPMVRDVKRSKFRVGLLVLIALVCLGSYGEVPADTPVSPSPLKFISVTAGSIHSCGLVTDGTVSCWGDNDGGQLGAGTNRQSALPVKVAAVSGARQIVTKAAHTCA